MLGCTINHLDACCCATRDKYRGWTGCTMIMGLFHPSQLWLLEHLKRPWTWNVWMWKIVSVWLYYHVGWAVILGCLTSIDVLWRLSGCTKVPDCTISHLDAIQGNYHRYYLTVNDQHSSLEISGCPTELWCSAGHQIAILWELPSELWYHCICQQLYNQLQPCQIDGLTMNLAILPRLRQPSMSSCTIDQLDYFSAMNMG